MASDREFQKRTRILFRIAFLLWAVMLSDIFIFRGRLALFGIRPRVIDGLWGIIFCPFLHAGFPHLIANTISFLSLGYLTMAQRTSDFWSVTLTAALTSGLGIWIFGAPGSLHIGASGVIFGYLGFLIFRGLFKRRLSTIFLSLFVAFFYGGLLWGVLPGHRGVSWEGHLFGLLGGIQAARKVK